MNAAASGSVGSAKRPRKPGDEAKTFRGIIKVSLLSERIEDSKAIPEYPGAFEGLRRRLRCHRQLRRDEVLTDRGDFSEAICISHL
jgi:hypothetical protein